MNNLSPAVQFENFVANIFEVMDYQVSISNEKDYDLNLNVDQQQYVIGIKYYRTTRAQMSLIKNAVSRLARSAIALSANKILVVSSIIEDMSREALEKESSMLSRDPPNWVFRAAAWLVIGIFAAQSVGQRPHLRVNRLGVPGKVTGQPGASKPIIIAQGLRRQFKGRRDGVTFPVINLAPRLAQPEGVAHDRHGPVGFRQRVDGFRDRIIEGKEPALIMGINGDFLDDRFDA